MAVEFQHVIREEVGLHARPAGLLVKKAKSLPCKVTVAFGGNSCEATRLLKLMALEAKHGDAIRITVEGDGETAAAAELKTFLEENL